ncbi:MAG TPA: hypothetical protein VFH80_35250 [Solirubrobacteraceae bacterium]|nr:hypothetical protein [Solirubrobacteraceae bacterium]
MDKAATRAPADARAGIQGPPAGAPRVNAILNLQRAAGNRAVGRVVLARRVIADVRTNSIGEVFAGQLTPDELKEQVAVLVDALEHDKLEPAARAAMQQNLEFLEGYGAARGTALPGATAHEFRQAIAKHADDVSRTLAILKHLAPNGLAFPHLDWHVEQLSWITEATARATQLVGEAEAGGEMTARKFAEAGTELTAAIFGLKAVSIILAYDDLFFEVATHYQGFTDRARGGMEMAHESLEPVLGRLRTRWGPEVDAAVPSLLPQAERDFAFDFGQRKDDIEADIKAWGRFLGWVNIAMLAWTAFDIWMLPVAGRPGGGSTEPPRIGGIGGIGGASGAATATAGTALATAESLAALRRLALIGAITGPQFVRFLGGRQGEIQEPPKPIEASGKGGGPSRASSAGSGKAPPSGGGGPTRAPEGVPTAAEDAVLKRYTEALAELREKLEAYKGMEPKPGEAPDRFQKRFGRARDAYESAQRVLDNLEEEALRANGSDLAGHLDPLVEARRELETQGPVAIRFGRRVPCDALKAAPRLTPGMEFAEIEKAIGRKPDFVEPVTKPGGAGQASAHQRLGWKFKDGSRLVVDKPARAEIGGSNKPNRPITAELPHVEVHGPGGERLDPQGIEIPKHSAPAHVTLSDVQGALESHFAQARKGL